MRLLAPLLAVSLLALLIGCGGGGATPSFGDDTGTSATDGSSSGDTGSTDLRAPAGSYTAAFSGNDGTTTFTGTGTATAAADGTIAVTLAAADTSNLAARSVTAVVSAAGAVTSGSVTVGSNAAAAIGSGALARQSNGTYVLTVVFANAAAATETDRYTLTFNRTVYTGPVTGSDTQGAAYTGTGTGVVTSGNALSLTYSSRRSLGGTVQQHSLSTTLLPNGTFSGSLSLGLTSTPATGTWANGVDANNVPTLTLRLTYVNTVYVGANGNPTATETLVLVRQ